MTIDAPCGSVAAPYRAKVRTLVLVACMLAACSGNTKKSPGGTAGDGDGQGDGDRMTTDPSHGLGDGDADGDGDHHVISGDGDTGSGQPIALDQCGADNAAGLSADAISALKTGGNAGGLRVLYPYDGTVFPRGLQAPLLMWDGQHADAVYLHIQGKRFTYDGCLKPSAEGQLQLADDVWKKAGQVTGGASDAYDLEVTVLNAGVAHGPIKQKLVIAQATLSGSIYYNSYNTGSGNPLGTGGNGSVLRIRPGQKAELFASQGKCLACHSVSYNGTRLVAMEFAGATDGQVYAITPDTQPNPPAKGTSKAAAFVGLYPDGSVYVSSGARNNVGPELQGGFMMVADRDATLFDTDTGNAIAGSGIPVTALMPTFSPDGKLLVFNDYAQGQGHALSLMDYANGTHKATNEHTLYTDNDRYLGWPFVLPDNHAVLFAQARAAASCTLLPVGGPCKPQFFDGQGVGISAQQGPDSDLAIADIASGKAYPLLQAIGYHSTEDLSAEKPYLPFAAEDVHQVYYPVVSPVASGGYFWVFFDSMRHYGNQGRHRQLWGTALTISPNGKYTADPSHPAFYIGGQDIMTANHRAFTALDPCHVDGDSCKSGIDCCGGRCTFAANDEFHEHGMCSSTTGSCARENEGCKVDSDCCAPPDGGDPYLCIAGFCATVGPIL